MDKGFILLILYLSGGLYLGVARAPWAAEASTLHDIWSHIFVEKNYNKNVRPVQHENTSTTINISLALISIIDFSEVRQTITLATKLTLAWRDEFLTWDAANFSDVEHVHVYQQDIWRPSIFLENAVTKQAEFGTPSLHVLVDSKGDVEWRTLEVFETTCMTDVTQFPFDEQSCSLVFEPFGYTDSEIKVIASADHFDIHSFGGASGWKIKETSLETAEGDEGVHVIASVTLRRNPVYMVLNIIMPIACLSLLTNCAFLLPVQSGEKASFAVTVFLALAVFLTIVSQQLPENSEHASLLNIYVILSTLTSVIVTILTILQVRLFHRNPQHKVPRCLAKLVRTCSSKRSMQIEHRDDKDKLFAAKTDVKRIASINENPLFTPVKHIENNNIGQVVDDSKLLEKDETKESRQEVEVTWPDLVKALDNILFIFFMLVYVCVTFGFITASVHGKYNRYADSHESDEDH